MSKDDLSLLEVTDDPAEAVDYIVRFYRGQAVDLSAPE
jgi:hypothetical protein